MKTFLMLKQIYNNILPFFFNQSSIFIFMFVICGDRSKLLFCIMLIYIATAKSSIQEMSGANQFIQIRVLQYYCL